MLILALESSCDETAASVSRDGREILSNVVYSQIDMHALYGGVVPEIASRKHAEKITAVAAEAMRQAGVEWSDLDAVAATCAPGTAPALVMLRVRFGLVPTFILVCRINSDRRNGRERSQASERLAHGNPGPTHQGARRTGTNSASCVREPL